MSTSPEQVAHKVRQLDNDVQAIYEMLAGIEMTQRRHTNRFEEVSEQIGSVDGKIVALEGRITAVDAKVDGVGTKIDKLTGRVTRLEGRFDGLEGRFDGLESKVDTILDILRGDPPAAD